MGSNKGMFWLGLGIFISLSLVGIFALSQGPDFEIQLERSVKSHAPVVVLQKSLHGLTRWPNWFFKLNSVDVAPENPILEMHKSGERVAKKESLQEVSGKKELQVKSTKLNPCIESEEFCHLSQGALLNLKLAAKFRTFELKVEVAESSSHRLKLKLLEDSTGRMTRLLKDVQWNIELIPNPEDKEWVKVQIVTIAKTQTPKSRFFGRIAPRILLHQITYPNLIALSETTVAPFSIDRGEVKKALY